MKNPNGFGTVVCLDKSGKKRRKPWAVRVTVGWENDKQKTKYLGYYSSQKEAALALAQHHMLGLDVDSNTITFKNVFDRWLERNSKKLTEKNQKAYLSAFKLVPVLHKRKFADIQPDQLQNVLDDVQKGRSSKEKIRSLLNQMYEYAVTRGYATRNCAKGLDILEKREKKGSPFSEEQLKTLWKHSDDKDVKFVLILIYTAVRISEAQDMELSSINFDDDHMIGGKKTEAGIDRVIPLHKAIKPFVLENATNRKYLFETSKKQKLTYYNATVIFNSVMDRFGWSGNHKLHDTRKTGISLLHSAGIPLESVQIIVGHAGQSVTEKVYLYKNAKELVDLVNKVDIPR